MNKLLRTTAASHSNQRVRHAPPLRRTALALLISACFGGAHANPLLPQVVNGQATFTQQGNVFSVTNTPNTIINWQSFSIASGELTRFIQQNGNSAVLNRITGQDPSKILGALESNGKVFLINPNGILFGAGSRVDVGGLVASSLGMTNQDFLAGKRSFTADGTPGSVINRGAINAAGGPVLLIAPQVENSGIITAPNGDVMLAAGHSVNLADPANPDLQVVLSAPADQAINVGQVIAQGGRIGMYGALLNQRGVLNADSAVRGENGKIVLKASARALLEDGSITSATGAGSGGNITVLGDQVGVLGNARVDASGKLGGGTVLLGGDYQGKNPAVPNARQVAVGKDASIAADAIDSGNGGKIIAWGNETARVAGSLSARGGALAGDGGLVETSGHYLAVDGIRVDTRARSTRGKPGNWLLDPYDIQVVQGAGGGLSAVDAFDSGPATGTTTIGADLISNAQTDVTLQALHRIDFDAAISIVSGGVGLSATAGEQINVNAPIMTSGGAVLLSANDNSGGSAAGAGGVLHLNAAIDTGNNDLSLSGASVSGAGALYVGAGSVRIVANAAGGAISLTGAPDQVTGSGFGQNITLVADQMNLAGGFNFGGADGAATVTLRPWTNSRDIHLGSNSDSSVMGLSAQDLAGLSVANVTVGYGEGSGTISVAAPLSLATGAGGAIRMLDLRTGSGGAINIDHALTLDGGLSLSSGNIGATGAVKLGGEFVLAGDWRQNSANLPAFSAAQIKVERGTFLRVAGGDGSTAAPYRIADVYGLQGINGLDLGASFIMANNIDGGVTANWNEGQGFTPLAGGAGAGFSGVFDGAGYAIRDLKIGSNGYATGLFSVVDGGTLRNLTLSGGSVSGNSNVGALAGAVFGGTISNVSSSMAVSGVGNTGGLVGSNAGAISNASASGTVDWRLSDGGAATGGLVGKNQATGTVTASYASGAVSSGFEFVGGLVGDNAGAVTQSYATGATRGARSVGGLVGRNAGSIDDAYASGAVSLSSNADALLTRENLGGFVGESPGTVRHAYSSGHVNPAGFNASTVGAVAGSAAGSFAFGFFNYETAGIEIDHSGSSGRSTAQMMQASSFNDYDFSSTWRIYEGHTTPLLKATLKPLTVAISNAPSSVEYAGAQVAFSGTLAYTGLANGDTAADGSVGYGAARNVGTYAAGGLWSTKYDISYSGATALTIRARELGVSVGGSKIYDGGTGFGAATLALTNVVAGDELLVGVSGSAAFADRNAGAGKTVNLTGLALAGDGASNYSLASSATGSATIAPRALSLGGVSGVNRVYDGSLAATISAQLDGVLGGDQVSLTGAAASFADKNIGSAKPVTYSVQTSNLAGADAANYSLTSASGSTTADITVRSLNLSLGANSKTYDGGISATTSITDSRVGGDVLTVGGTATFSDRNAGVGKTVTLNGVTLSGADAANYVLSPGAVSGTANIDQRRLTGTFAGVDKVYDGGSGASVIIGDNRVDGDVLSLAATAAFADKNAGVGKTVSVSGVTLSGADAGNYTLASNTGSTTASITARGLTASFSGVNKTYDGTRSAIVTSNDNRIDGDVLTVAATAAFGDKNAASGKAVSVSDAHLSGADAGNYTLTSTSGSTTAAITARDLNASFAGVNKTYDGTTAASVTSSDNRIDGDVLNVAVTAAFGDKNAASGKAVSVSGAHLSGADAGNYTLTSTSGSTTAAITARELSASFAGVNKTYDGATAASVTSSDNRIDGDVLNVAATAVFGDKNVASGKAVSVSGAHLSGADAGNYTLTSTSGSTTAAITARELSASFAGVNKTYDGTTAASVTSSDNRIDGDVLNVAATAVFGDKNVASGKEVSVSGAHLSGADAGNYTLTSTSGSTTATITARDLNASFAGVNKTYDGTTAASVTSSDNRIDGDVLNVTATAAFGNKNAAGGKAVSVSDAHLSGTDAGNYTLTSTSGSTTAAITARELSASFAGVNKTYDGTTAAGVTSSDNRIDGDVLNVAANAVFGDKNAASGKVVSVSGARLSGADAGNYTLTSTSGSTTAAITARALNASFAGVNKTYDGTRSASVTSSDNRINGDVLNVTATATFGDKNAASGKAVSISDARLSGADAGNYTLTSTSGLTTAAITTRDLNASFAGVNKTYDGTRRASVTSSDNRINGDVLNVTATATFGDKNAASGKAVSISDARLSGADAGNYTLTSTIGSTTAAITARDLNASFAGVNKTYDGTTAASVTSSDNRIDGDVLNVAATAAFGDKNAASGKAVSVSGVTLSGADAGNYTLASSTTSTTAAITARDLNASFAGVNKTYDGTRSASVTSSDNRIDGDVLNVAATAAFGDKNAASGKAVSVSGVTLSGADAGNYTLASSTASTSAAITALELSASFAGVNKTYNGTTAASVTSSDNRIGGDVLKVVATAVFGDKNAASGKAVVVSDVRLSGADAGNYTLASTTGSTTADITARALNLRYSGGDRVYDGTRSASVSLGDDRLDGDILSVAVQASFADKNVGVNKPVSLSGVALGGADAGNYRVVTPAGLLATITPAALSLSAVSASNKVYDGTQTASVSGTLGGVIAQDAVSLTGGSGVFADKNAGAGKVVTASGFRLAGSDAGNYTLSNTGGVTQADIAQRALSTWTGPAGGLWSDAANWENGVAPDASNVLAATAAAGSGSIIYDAAAGDTVLGTINFGRGLNLSGGSLRIGQATTDSASVRDLQISGGKLALTGALAVANYAQTGGALDGSGSLAVSNSFSQSAGSIALGGALAASQASGDLLFASLAAQSISLSAPGGAIAQSGAVVTDSLTTQSQSGATLNNKGNLVASFTASNSGAGGIALTSTTASGQLLLGSLGTGSGNIVIENIGGIETHAINANGGNVSVTAHGPVMVRGVIQGNDVTVTAGADITLEGAAAVRAARALALDANASIALNGTSALEAGAAGSMSLLARTGNISAVSGVRIDSHGAPLTLRAPLGSVQMPSSVFASGTLPVINGVATTTPTSPVVIVAVREAINLINTSLQIPNPTPNGSFSNVEQFGQSVTKSDSNSTTGSKKDDSIKKTYCN